MPTAVDENKEGEYESGDGTLNLPSDTAEAPHLLVQPVRGSLKARGTVPSHPPVQIILPRPQFDDALALA